MLDPTALSAAINHPLADELSFTILNVVDSTSGYLLQNPFHKGRVCIADQQTSGRGRYGNSWYSPADKNLYLSVSWAFDKDTVLRPLSLLASTAVATGLRSCGFESVGIKWPNDFFIGKCKVGGLLIDTVFRGDGSINVVIGVGINVRSQNFPEDIGQPVTSLEDKYAAIVRTDISRETIAAKILSALLDVFLLDDAQWPRQLKVRWDAFDIAQNNKVVVTHAGREVVGMALGINDALQLLLFTSSGQEECYDDSDSSMRLL